jgi:DNA helicase-2/ATP-dependent DNA helicase PcrA
LIDLLQGLTEAQREAVLHVDGPLLILAGPGSGKTRVITHRVAHLLHQGIPPSQILALTFTNKAADEMRARIEQLAPQQSIGAGTFHRFCARLLRKYAQFAGLEANYTIYDAEESLKTLCRTISELKIDPTLFGPDALATAISWAKNNLVMPQQYEPRPGNAIGAVVKRVYPAYQERLRRSNAVDFDDLLLHVATLLRENSEVRQDLDERYRYILVDEYQDTNLAQYAIARALSIDYPNLAVTGDPDQSIYGWRGANLHNILEFEKDFPRVRVVRLEQNYRSTKRILRVAADLIRHNVKRKQKDLFTENGEGRPVRLVTYRNEREEAQEIAAEIAAEIRAGRRRPRDFAIFYRINALSRAFEAGMHNQGIAYQLVRGLEFFKRKEIKDVLAYLQLLNNPRDEGAFLRVINTPTRGIGKTALQRLTDHARQHALTLLEAARDAAGISTLNKRAATAIREFAAIVDRLAQVGQDTIEEILGSVLSDSQYEQRLQDSGDADDQERLANIQELLTVARQFDEQYDGADRLERFLEQTSLVSDTDDWQSQNDRVTLMTLHASKGLEFPVVYLVAVEEGLLPHDRSSQRPEQLEEERRLMFVGITRAQEELQISRAEYRDFRGQRNMTVPSQFLMELPREDMEIRELKSASHCEERDFEETTAAGPYREPVFPASLAKRAGLRLTTAAELAGGSASAPVSPDVFHHGMLVRHPHYGLGRIVALSGSGSGRKATVDFASAVGRMKFVLEKSPLRPVGN